jgi:DNA-binding transcriptional LysR family regulator
MVVEAEAAQEAIDLTHSDPCGIVRITCPIALLDACVGVMLADFMVRNPRVEVHLDATNRRVDIISEAVDVAIRVRPPPLEESDLVMRVFATRGQCLVASSAMVERLHTPRVPADLTRLPSLDHGAPQDEHVWNLFGPDGAQARIRHHPRLITGGMIALRDAALAGVGIVQLPNMMISDQLASRSLVRLLPEWAPRPEIVHAVYASRRGLLPSVRALIDHLADRFKNLDDN